MLDIHAKLNSDKKNETFRYSKYLQSLPNTKHNVSNKTNSIPEPFQNKFKVIE